jgi:Lyzozyme M1 (1,4-beta-N-acetylmuramidase)
LKEQCFDISTWQGGIDYNALRQNANYCILRAGFSESEDNEFENHYNNLQGLNLGAYWYSYAESPEEARKEARKFLKVIGDKKFTLPLYLDLEDPSLSGLGRATLNEIVTAFGEIIENAGYYFGVYTNLNWYRNVISGYELNMKYDWWIACWSDNAPDNVDYGIWQYTSNYNLNGMRIDADYVFKDYPTIIRNAGLNHLEDTPAPEPTPSKTIDELAKEVIEGKWGNGDERVKRLTEAGYDYNRVQTRVNEILYGNDPYYYTIQAGDTLSEIAVMFNTTVVRLCELNNISNPDLIYAGNTIRVR